MRQTFGQLLRKARREEGKTLGELARALGISVVYLSDVERGNRKPFAKKRILNVADLLKRGPEELLRAADFERGFIEYDIAGAKPLEADVVTGLVAGLARGGLSEGQLLDIQGIIEGNKKSDE